MKQIYFLVLLFSTEVVNAQTDFQPGYVIELAGDTLLGQIDYRGDILMGTACKFKDHENMIKNYSPSEIAAFRFTDSKYYVSKVVHKKKVFLEYLINGVVDIYYLRDDSGDHYFIEKEGIELTEIPYDEEIKYIGDKQVYYESKKHIGLLYYYMQDALDFQSRIQLVKKPEHKNLIRLAKDYHNAVCEDEKCIIYERQPPAIKILPELLRGIINYSNVDNLNDKNYLQTGIIGHIWMPRVSEKLYFRTGVLISQLEIDGQTTYFRVPLQLEYIYPKGFFRPRLAYGLNYYFANSQPVGNVSQSVSFDLGANIKLSRTLFLTATSDIEFNPTRMVLPSSFLAQSMKLGILLNLN
ncbi:MAG: hypothetical protein RJQ14_13110 [Marinoscillum sp.]